MSRTHISLAAAVAFAAMVGVALHAQAPTTSQAPAAQPAKTPAPPEPPPVPLKVQVTITRLQKDVVVSRLPFTLWVNANDRETSLNLGSSVPVPQNAISGAVPIQSISYQPAATNIRCSATTAADGRYRVMLNVNDSSVAANKESGMPPIMQSMQANNLLLLRDGQLAEFASATDKVTGEVTRIDVMVTAIK